MTKLIGDFHNIANAPKNLSSYGLDWIDCGYFVTTGIYVLVVSLGSVRPEFFNIKAIKSD